MTGEPASHSTSPTGSAALPPVYTNWGEASPITAAALEMIAPYFAGDVATPDKSGEPGPRGDAGVDAASGITSPHGAVSEEVAGVTSIWSASHDVPSLAPATAAAQDLAERLETIARRLRTDGTAAVVAGMRGDRFDALLAGLFAGYLAAHDPDS